VGLWRGIRGNWGGINGCWLGQAEMQEAVRGSSIEWMGKMGVVDRVGRPMNGSGRWWLLGQASTKVKDDNNTKAQAGVRLLASRNDAA
jgi:hypothetical protein